jgi:uroporphyrin-3 C-methyltransferase
VNEDLDLPATDPERHATSLTVRAPASPGASQLMWLRAAGVALLVIGVIACIALALAWKAEQRGASLEQELVRRQQEDATQTAQALMLAKQSQDGMNAVAAKIALLEARVSEVSTQRGQLEELIQSLSRSRDENMLVDVEQGIRVALQQTAITGSAEPLVAALKQSADRLARSDLPRLDGVRRAIARDLDRVKAVSVADVASLAIKLDETIRMVDELPLVSVAQTRGDGSNRDRGAVASSATPASTASGASGWAGSVRAAWDSAASQIWNEAKSLVRVTRIEHPDAMLLAPDQSFFLRENLKLRLLNARLALLSRQFDTAQADLQVAQASLDRYFDRNSKRTALASELIRQVVGQARQVGVPRPDDTLAALMAASAGR